MCRETYISLFGGSPFFHARTGRKLRNNERQTGLWIQNVAKKFPFLFLP